jgi:hypothetical protein
MRDRAMINIGGFSQGRRIQRKEEVKKLQQSQYSAQHLCAGIAVPY